jgi:hypothetical protein
MNDVVAWRQSCVIALLLGPLAFNVWCAGPIDPNARELFEQEYVRKRQEWKTIQQTLPLAIEMTTEEIIEGKTTQKVRTIRRREGENFVFAMDVTSGSPTKYRGGKIRQYCYGRNTRYSFELGKNDTGEWLLTNFVMPPPAYADMRQTIVYPPLNAFLFPDEKKPAPANNRSSYTPRKDDFDNLASSKGFRLLSATSENADSELVSIRYEGLYSDGYSTDQYQAISTAVFNRHRYWALVEYTTVVPDIALERRVVNVLREDTNYPLFTTSRSTSRVTKDGGRPTTEVATTYTTDINDLPVTAFTLSSFGLPEPHGLSWDAPTPISSWLVVFAVGAAFVAIILVYYARRTSKTG